MNEKAISQATIRYDGEVKKEYLLKPISREDLEIVMELTEICKKANVRGINEAMENYKVNPDKEVLEQLSNVRKSIKEKTEKPKSVVPKNGEGENQAIFRMIKFNDLETRRIYQPNIVSYLRFYNEVDNEFGIFLNECDETLQRQPLHANTMLIYRNEKEREKDFLMLDEYFS